MKKLRLPLLAIFFSLFLIKCTKDDKTQETKTTEQIITSPNNNMLSIEEFKFPVQTNNPERVDRIIKDRYIQDIKNFENNSIQKPSPLDCNISISANVVYLDRIRYIQNGTVYYELTYTWTLLETQCCTGTFNYFFNLNGVTTNFAPEQLPSGTVVVGGNTYKKRTFIVHYTLSEADYRSSSSGIFNVSAISTCSPLVNKNYSLEVEYPPYYCGNLPIVYVTSGGNGSSFLVSTECNLTPFPPNTICPQYGTLYYRPLGSSTWIGPVIFPTNGIIVSGLQNTMYEYRVSLFYSGYNCSTIELTGTVQP
jgi:hypothetical protein